VSDSRAEIPRQAYSSLLRSVTPPVPSSRWSKRFAAAVQRCDSVHDKGFEGRQLSARSGQSLLFAIKRWTAPRLSQFERWFIAELAHFYTNNIDS
jgi:hypothetical protein